MSLIYKIPLLLIAFLSYTGNIYFQDNISNQELESYLAYEDDVEQEEFIDAEDVYEEYENMDNTDNYTYEEDPTESSEEEEQEYRLYYDENDIYPENDSNNQNNTIEEVVAIPNTASKKLRILYGIGFLIVLLGISVIIGYIYLDKKKRQQE